MKMSDDEAIARTVQECIDKNILKEFFEQNKQEVAIMLKNEWSGNIVAEAAWEDGVDEGERKEKQRMARVLLAKGMDKNEVAEVTGLTIDDILRLL
jgi:predicted transposase/invertase (TIGR01784 family)